LKIIHKILIIAVILTQSSFANLDYSAKMGLNVGGTMPFPLPANISKIENYSPNFAPAIEAEALRWLNKKFGVSAGIRFENKGMKSTALVKEFSMNFGDWNGKFEGTVDTEIGLNYLGLPILAHYALMENIFVYAGAYYAYLLDGKFKGAVSHGDINDGKSIKHFDKPEEYDFSNELRNYDAGLSIGLNFLPYNEHILFSFDFNYGLVSVFQSDFKGIADDMQNIYGKFSIGYLF